MAIFGGDLNIRDDEVKAVQKDLGAEASCFSDVFLFLGSPPAQQWTWDTTANSNVGANYACKTRFDRIFFLSSGVSEGSGTFSTAGLAKGKTKATAQVQGCCPTSMCLLGKEKVPGLDRFPSDHWGVLTSWTHSKEPGTASESTPATKKVVIDLED